MDRVSLLILTVGLAFMLVCTTLIAYQNVRIAQIQQYTIDLIQRTHPATGGN